jgi:hypothetical protein
LDGQTLFFGAKRGELGVPMGFEESEEISSSSEIEGQNFVVLNRSG